MDFVRNVEVQRKITELEAKHKSEQEVLLKELEDLKSKIEEMN